MTRLPSLPVSREAVHRSPQQLSLGTWSRQRLLPWQQAGLGSRRGASGMGFLVGTPQSSSCLASSLFHPPLSFFSGDRTPGLRVSRAIGRTPCRWLVPGAPGPRGPGEGFRARPGRPRAGTAPASVSEPPLPMAASSAAAAWWWATGTGCATARWERSSTSTTWSSGPYVLSACLCLGAAVDRPRGGP